MRLLRLISFTEKNQKVLRKMLFHVKTGTSLSQVAFKYLPIISLCLSLLLLNISIICS